MYKNYVKEEYTGDQMGEYKRVSLDGYRCPVCVWQ